MENTPGCIRNAPGRIWFRPLLHQLSLNKARESKLKFHVLSFPYARDFGKENNARSRNLQAIRKGMSAVSNDGARRTQKNVAGDR
jgi:hypothetical protein